MLRELSDKNSEFYFSELDNEIPGNLKVNSRDFQTEIKNEKHLKLKGSMYLKNFTEKVGQILYRNAIEPAKEINPDFG